VDPALADPIPVASVNEAGRGEGLRPRTEKERKRERPRAHWSVNRDLTPATNAPKTTSGSNPQAYFEKRVKGICVPPAVGGEGSPSRDKKNLRSWLVWRLVLTEEGGATLRVRPHFEKKREGGNHCLAPLPGVRGEGKLQRVGQVDHVCSNALEGK